MRAVRRYRHLLRHRFLSLTVVGTLLLTFLALAATPGQAQPPRRAIPPLPDARVINTVISRTARAVFLPIEAPPAALNALRTSPAGAALADRADTARAVTVFGLGEGLNRTIIPTRGLAEAFLAPDARTPDDNRPAQIVGAVVEPGRPARQVVMVWSDPYGLPSEVRFYDADNRRIPDDQRIGLVIRELRGDETGLAAPIDQGVVVAARETCYTVGLTQACLTPETFTPDQQAMDIATETAQILTAAYDFDVTFDLEGALSEVIGDRQRQACARSLASMPEVAQATPRECEANLVFTAASRIEEGQPIGLFRVLRDVELTTFDVRGITVPRLPAGAYLVMNATPRETRLTPGAPGALFLVNADGRSHFLIASRVMEAFGSSDDPEAEARRGQAAIKYGLIAAQGF